MRTSRFRAVALLVVPALMSCRAATEVGVTGDDLIFLDAETLAEGGIAAAHAELLAEIRAHAPGAEPIEERLDAAAGRYAVSSDGREYVIYAPGGETEPGESWARATHALFEIVNEQLAASQVRFYAINGGNDLAGRFLAPEEAERLRSTTDHRAHWPYAPTLEPPWYGMYH